jgi:hypothetical protein
MKKQTLLFWLDAGLLMMLGITLLTAGPEFFSHTFMHVILGILLSGGALLHLGLHWDWIKRALQGFGQLPDTVRRNALVDLALFCAYAVCGGVGLISRAMVVFLPLHVFLAVIHVLLAVGVMVLQMTHIILHWKWLAASARRLLVSRH